MSKKGERLNEIEHLLRRPDMYIGSIVTEKNHEMFLWSDEKESMIWSSIKYNPGLFNIIREIGANAIDNKSMSGVKGAPKMSYISFALNQQDGSISIENDGNFIRVKKENYEYKDPYTTETIVNNIYPAELYFSYFRAGTNFNDEEKRRNAGRNGYGSKATNVFSESFLIEHSDPENGLELSVEYRDNLGFRGVPEITKYARKTPYTRITFVPDYERFKYRGRLDNDLVACIERFAYDTAMLTYLKVKFSVINSKGVERAKVISIPTLTKYAKMYFPTCTQFVAKSSDEENDIVLIETSREQETDQDANDVFSVSFVNGILTEKGGVHVDSWREAIFPNLVRLLNDKMSTRTKTPLKTSSKQIYGYFALFVRASVDNPSFDTQTKDRLNNPPPPIIKFDKDELEKISKWKFFALLKEKLKSAKERSDAKKEKTKGKLVFGDKAEDANIKDRRQFEKFTLFITEGDSAHTLAKSMIPFLPGGTDYNGSAPVRGKFVNVSTAKSETMINNEEIKMLQAITGLYPNTDYNLTENRRLLRYGRIVSLCDADEDGYHIKGLLVNFFYRKFKNVFEEGIVNFFSENTPVVKIWKKGGNLRKSPLHTFYSNNDYKQWAKAQSENFIVRYYKGLGSHRPEDIPHLVEERKQSYFSPDETYETHLDLAFGKDTDKRKEWMMERLNRDPSENNERLVVEGDQNISDFINNELILFELSSLPRAIPSVFDGLKESQRKVLFTFLKENITSSVKVESFAGDVLKSTAYHHGQASLNGTIVKMVQGIVGKNNIPLLVNDGQYGSRANGGDDHASARYIFTYLDSITRKLFPKKDDSVLEYLEDDGVFIEPKWYVPILPMILINGADGIATGWSTNIPCFNPLDLKNWIVNWLKKEELPALVPWYRGFNGEIKVITEKSKGENVVKYITSGVVEVEEYGDYIITELPIGKWTSSMKVYLENLSLNEKDKNGDQIVPKIRDIRQNHNNNSVWFRFTPTDVFDYNRDLLPEMTTKISTTNMVALDERGFPKRYTSPEEILEDFCKARLKLYEVRKKKEIKELGEEIAKLKSQSGFIEAVWNNSLDITLDEDELVPQMEEEGFVKCPNEKDSVGYDYLLNMPVRSLSQEKCKKILEKVDKLETELESVEAKTEADLWMEELEDFEKEYIKFLERRTEEPDISNLKPKINGTKKKSVNSSSVKSSVPKSLGKATPKAKAKAKAKPKAKATRRTK